MDSTNYPPGGLRPPGLSSHAQALAVTQPSDDENTKPDLKARSEDEPDKEPNLGRAADRIRDGKEKRKLRYWTRQVVVSAGSGSNVGAARQEKNIWEADVRANAPRTLGARGLLKHSVARKIGAKRDKR